MAVKGTIAKEYIVKELQKAFGEDYLGKNGDKYYVMANDGGEKVQIAVSLTCPKVPVVDMLAGGGPVAAAPVAQPTEISKEEEDSILDLMRRLGL